MSTYAERSRPDGCSNHRYCRSCDQYYDGYVDDKECQVCAGVVTPERIILDAELIQWVEDNHASVECGSIGDEVIWQIKGIVAATTWRGTVRTAMEAEGAREKGEGGETVIDQRVEFMEWVPQKITDVEPDVFVFKPRGNKLWVWVLRAVWKFLADTGAVKPNYITTTTYTRRVLEPMKFMEQIFKQRTELRRMFYKDGQRLLIGAEDYRDLMNDKEVSMTYFQFSTQFHVGQPGGKYNICGLIVEVVPWMRGMIVMPEENSAVKVNSRH